MVKDRVFNINSVKYTKGTVVYWMSREQRIFDNDAFIFAYNQALLTKSSFYVFFCISPNDDYLNFRNLSFIKDGLKEVAKSLEKMNIPLFLEYGNTVDVLNKFIQLHKVKLLVIDFNPLKKYRRDIEEINISLNISLIEVDSHNIVPCRLLSQKKEYGAYTLRPKINKIINDFLVDYEQVRKYPYNNIINNLEIDEFFNNINCDKSVSRVLNIKAGYFAGMDKLHDFLGKRLVNYAKHRNNPNFDAQSGLSAYINYGQISARRIAMEVIKLNVPDEDKGSFLEELIVRRELSDNFCFYNNDYDNFNGFNNWAKADLIFHKKDKREYIYSYNDFETAKTHDKLWNAAQIQMATEGVMHGYLRMYWAKKILEWTKEPEIAMEIAVSLNDKYSLDGRSPNGYAGCAWAIGGTHDRPWLKRPIFGMIRYMNYKGCERKFDVNLFISKYIKQ